MPEKPERPGRGHISGHINGGKEHGSVTVELWLKNGDAPAYTITVEDGVFSICDVEKGEYILKISKENFVTREYDVDLDGDEIIQDAQMNLQGDVTGDGKVNVGDVSKVYAHVKGSVPIEDEYLKGCANVSGDKDLNIADTARIYAHARGTKKMH